MKREKGVDEVQKFFEGLDDEARHEIQRKIFRFSVVDDESNLLVKIPHDVTFQDLDLTYTDHGYVYSRGVIDYIAEHNHVRFADLEEQIISFIGVWYRDHLLNNGEHDVVMDRLIKETRLTCDYPGVDDDWFINLV